GTSGTVTYEYPFIPRSHGDFTIAPVNYSYYDVTSGKYVTLTTPALDFTVKKGKETRSSSDAGTPVEVSRSGVRNLNEDIRYISTRLSGLSPKGSFLVLSWQFWLSAFLIVLLALCLWLGLHKMAARRADVAGTRNRKANKMAVRRLKAAREYLGKNLYSAFYEELHRALLGYAADKLNTASGELSKELIASRFLESGVPADVVESFTGMIDACEYARYSPDQGHEVMSSQYDEAERVISSIETKMKVKNNRTAAGAVVMAVLLSVSSLGIPVEASAANAADSYVDSLWNTATAAYGEGRWADAARGYCSISSLGLESAALYCNIGDSYFKDGDVPRAILFYERALKLDPSYSDARYNLGIASSRIQDRIDTVPEFILVQWWRNLCYVIDSDSWAVLALVFFAAALAMLLLFLLGRTSAARKGGFFSSIACVVLLAVCLWFSLWQRSDYLKADTAIVMRPVSAVKSAPSSESSTDLFVLHEGTKVTILDEVGQWRNISLADGRQGWMLSGDMEVI
ncbi:MAG: tetratricopeptide repeat protein, partial [Candidatus Cryptobacteroides sp.]